MKCPYCASTQGRCATTSTGRSITECASCGRVVEERQFQNHHLFHLRAQDNPLCLVTSDLPSLPKQIHQNDAAVDEDPFHPTGFVTAFSAWSLEPTPVFLRSSLPFSGHLAELERIFELIASTHAFASASVAVDNLRAYMQIIDVASILGLDRDISDHAFQLFRDCCSATCLRNRSVEALATAALVQAIREAQEPRTLQEISIAANVPQKEIGKYIKILGEALQLSQPINSNSIAVHMPRFCTLLQLNKTAQELATHIGEVVINKCFCTRRNPISISAAAIYLACQLEDKRKTQAEICKVTGLTEVTLRKVYKELLENWDDLLPSNYTPAVPPEKAFPTTAISSGRTPAVKVESSEVSSIDKGKQPENKSIKPNDVTEAEANDDANGAHTFKLNRPNPFSQPWLQFTASNVRTAGEKSQSVAPGGINDVRFNCQDLPPSKYTPAVPPEKAFPSTAITSGHSQVVKVNSSEITSLNKEKQPETKPIKSNEVREAETNDEVNGAHTLKLKRPNPFSQPLPHFMASNVRPAGEKGHCVIYGAINEVQSDHQDLLSSNYTPSVPLEKAFPIAAYASGHTPAVKASSSEVTSLDRDKQLETKSVKLNEAPEAESDDDAIGSHPSFKMNLQYPIGRPWHHFTPPTFSTAGEKNQSVALGGFNDKQSDSKDLLTSNFTPPAPPEKVSPTATFASGQIPAVKVDLGEVTSLDKDKQPETKSIMENEVTEAETDNCAYGGHSSFQLNQQYSFGQPWFHFLPFTISTAGEKNQTVTHGAINEVHCDSQDLLLSNFTPAIPREKSFPTATITSGRTPARVYSGEVSSLEKDKQPETMIIKGNEVAETNVDANGAHTFYKSKQSYAFDQPWPCPFNIRTAEENFQKFRRDLDQKVDEDSKLAATSSMRPSQFPGNPMSNMSSFAWPFLPSSSSVATPSVNVVHPPKLQPGHVELNRTGIQAKVKNANQCEE